MTEEAAVRAASIIAYIFYVFKWRMRRNVQRNIDVLSAKDVSAYSVFKNFSRTIVDFLKLHALTREQLRAKCSLEGIDNLDRALEKKRGAVLITGHIGPWEIAGATLASHGYRIHAVALEHPSARVTRFFSTIRGTWEIKDYPLGESITSLIKALRNNETVVLLIDRNFSTRGLELPFFGRDTLLPNGHIILSMRTGSPLLPCCCYYNDRGTIDAFIGEEIPVAEPDSSADSIGRRCLERIERCIESHPDQWFAFDHLWPEDSHA